MGVPRGRALLENCPYLSCSQCPPGRSLADGFRLEPVSLSWITKPVEFGCSSGRSCPFCVFNFWVLVGNEGMEKNMATAVSFVIGGLGRS